MKSLLFALMFLSANAFAGNLTCKVSKADSTEVRSFSQMEAGTIKRIVEFQDPSRNNYVITVEQIDQLQTMLSVYRVVPLSINNTKISTFESLVTATSQSFLQYNDIFVSCQ